MSGNRPVQNFVVTLVFSFENDPKTDTDTNIVWGETFDEVVNKVLFAVGQSLEMNDVELLLPMVNYRQNKQEVIVMNIKYPDGVRGTITIVITVQNLN